jgi:hypothetical protein
MRANGQPDLAGGLRSHPLKRCCPDPATTCGNNHDHIMVSAFRKQVFQWMRQNITLLGKGSAVNKAVSNILTFASVVRVAAACWCSTLFQEEYVFIGMPLIHGAWPACMSYKLGAMTHTVSQLSCYETIRAQCVLHGWQFGACVELTSSRARVHIYPSCPQPAGLLVKITHVNAKWCDFRRGIAAAISSGTTTEICGPGTRYALVLAPPIPA